MSSLLVIKSRTGDFLIPLGGQNVGFFFMQASAHACCMAQWKHGKGQDHQEQVHQKQSPEE